MGWSSVKDLESLRREFWKRVDRAGDCWEWTLSTGNHGYGQWLPASLHEERVYRRNWLTHRMAWFLTYGPVPPPMTVDHLCRNRRCCNPAHLRLLTNKQNASDNGFNRRTHCPSGHPYDEANTAIYKTPTGHDRTCLACKRARARRYQARKAGL